MNGDYLFYAHRDAITMPFSTPIQVDLDGYIGVFDPDDPPTGFASYLREMDKIVTTHLLIIS